MGYRTDTNYKFVACALGGSLGELLKRFDGMPYDRTVTLAGHTLGGDRPKQRGVGDSATVKITFRTEHEFDWRSPTLDWLVSLSKSAVDGDAGMECGLFLLEETDDLHVFGAEMWKRLR